MFQAAGSIDPVTSSFQDVGTIGGNALCIALIGPQERRRKAVAAALAGPLCGMTREFSSYPEPDEVPGLIAQNYDVVIVDLDSNPMYVPDLVESICSHSSATVMVYSEQADPELMIRCMRAGVREFLTPPFPAAAIEEALVRAAARRPASPSANKTGGRLFVFLGSKGGSGVTTVACNFAILLARESRQKTLLIDFDLPLGDIALGLGITAPYSAVDALQNSHRLDSTFLSKLLVKYDAGLSVLTAPGKFSNAEAAKDALDKLLTVARQDFDYVVVDSGSRLDLTRTALSDEDAMFYLVTQVGIPELRNSNRLISEFFAANPDRLEVVVNRYLPSRLGIDEGHITKALTRPAQWKIPEDQATARRTQNTATPLAQNESPISRVILQMARAACGRTAPAEKKKRFGLFS
jgi:pilus assembly protein CpaE